MSAFEELYRACRRLGLGVTCSFRIALVAVIEQHIKYINICIDSKK